MNDPKLRPVLNNNSRTLCIVGGALVTGYVYGLLSCNEYSRRYMYGQYYNVMYGFDVFRNWLDGWTEFLSDKIINFDSSYVLWKVRTLKLQEWR